MRTSAKSGCPVMGQSEVYLAHRTDRAPEIPVEDKPSDKPDGRRHDNHHIEQETPFANRRRTHDGIERAYKRDHDEERRLLQQKRRGNLPPRIRQERIERAPRTEIATSMPSAVAKSSDKANSHVQEEAVCKIRIAPTECQHNHEQHRFYNTLNANLAMLFHATYYTKPPRALPHPAAAAPLLHHSNSTNGVCPSDTLQVNNSQQKQDYAER